MSEPNELPDDYKAFIAEAHAAASRHGLALAWDDARGALLVRRDVNVDVGLSPTRLDEIAAEIENSGGAQHLTIAVLRALVRQARRGGER